MTVNRRTPTLDALARTMGRLPGRWMINVVFGETDSAIKARFLKESGRDFFAATPALQQAVTQAVAGYVHAALASPETLDPLRAMQVAADAARAHFLARFERQGGDVTLAPLSPAYRDWKARKPGLDPRIGVAWGRLYRDLKTRARVLARRVGT